jgi:hypothetical protein
VPFGRIEEGVETPLRHGSRVRRRMAGQDRAA